ncbi:hypothetical protein BpHYR1_013658 [Brachionus plicatilis]|uniref:Uncharacterized protein n=1 Tax=Brachionus plicatilis TaxID=10195 RepID=A0A3M7SXX6_BRAPC|nr:hypothetical protein BpHYR1_013658 [Brachionus plicatilis]
MTKNTAFYFYYEIRLNLGDTFAEQRLCFSHLLFYEHLLTRAVVHSTPWSHFLQTPPLVLLNLLYHSTTEFLNRHLRRVF